MTVSCSLRFSAGSSVKITKHNTNANNRHARQNGKVKRLIGQLRVDNFPLFCLSNCFLQELFANGKVKTKKRVPYGSFPKNDMNFLGSSVEIKVVL